VRSRTNAGAVVAGDGTPRKMGEDGDTAFERLRVPVYAKRKTKEGRGNEQKVKTEWFQSA